MSSPRSRNKLNVAVQEADGSAGWSGSCLTASSPVSPLVLWKPVCCWFSRRLHSSCTCFFRFSTSIWCPASICLSLCWMTSVCSVSPSSSRWLRDGCSGLMAARPSKAWHQRCWEQFPRGCRIRELQLAKDTCRLRETLSPFTLVQWCPPQGSPSELSLSQSPSLLRSALTD